MYNEIKKQTPNTKNEEEKKIATKKAYFFVQFKQERLKIWLLVPQHKHEFCVFQHVLNKDPCMDSIHTFLAHQGQKWYPQLKNVNLIKSIQLKKR